MAPFLRPGYGIASRSRFGQQKLFTKHLQESATFVMSSTAPQPTKTGLGDLNIPSSVESTSSPYQLYYIRFYSPTKNSRSPSSYALGYRPRWGSGPMDASTTIYIGCAPGTAGRLEGKPYRKTNIAAEKRAKQVERADVHWLGKVNDLDRVVEIMGKVCWNNGTNIGQAQKRWCQRVAMRIDWGRTWVVAGWVTLPEDEKMAGRVWTLAS
ncbi:hypothetical protein BofuT4_P139020.1 [Botrytis cinerea T4]|uniref:Uncharacterized protein n=1 Tax=Botryotinia fuckeliana (strain T4) TaxID=999810 RepID=G2YMY0_BOTF4|nr:hypothetical protein BofuT4_P139020.1 [Botrytis cinerea T4]